MLDSADYKKVSYKTNSQKQNQKQSFNQHLPTKKKKTQREQTIRKPCQTQTKNHKK